MYYGEPILSENEQEQIQGHFFCASIIFTSDIERIKACSIIFVTQPKLWKSVQSRVLTHDNFIIASKLCESAPDVIELKDNKSPFKLFKVLMLDTIINGVSSKFILETIESLLEAAEYLEDKSHLLMLSNFFEINLNSEKVMLLAIVDQKIHTFVQLLSSSYEAKTPENVILYFLYVLGLAVIKLTYNFIPQENEDLDELLNRYKSNFFLNSYIDIRFNFNVSTIGTTFVLNFLTRGCNFYYISKCYSSRRDVYTIDPVVKSLLLDSLHRIAQTEEGKKILNILDNQELAVAEEISIIENLVNENVISIPPTIKVAGKLALGGYICITQSTLDYHSLYPLGCARFLYVYRHEFAHKKFLLKAVNHDYLARSPEVSDDSRTRHESDFLRDQITCGNFNLMKKPELTDQLLFKTLVSIITGSQLSEEEKDNIFYSDNLEGEEDLKTLESFKRKSNSIFCGGRGTVVVDD